MCIRDRFIALLGMGVTGAAWATVLGYCVGGVIPVVYFLLPRREGLRLVRTNFYGRELLHACINGSSELMSNISASVVGILYNIRLMDLLGEPGVAAHSVMMYVDFVFVAAFLGFSMGSAPIVSYHYGAENYDELKNIFRRSGVIIAATSVAMVAASELLSRPLSAAFVGYLSLIHISVLHADGQFLPANGADAAQRRRLRRGQADAAVPVAIQVVLALLGEELHRALESQMCIRDSFNYGRPDCLFRMLIC